MTTTTAVIAMMTKNRSSFFAELGHCHVRFVGVRLIAGEGRSVLADLAVINDSMRLDQFSSKAARESEWKDSGHILSEQERVRM